MKYNDKYRIKTTRVSWHDYSGGAYFITICTNKHIQYFGRIIEEGGDCKMEFTMLGRIVENNLLEVNKHYPYASIPLFVVMPNHIHAILVIDGRLCGHTDAKQSASSNAMSHHRSTMSVVIGGLKRAVSHYAHQNNVSFAWQPSFYDHIIRSQEEMNEISSYITNNVGQWYCDKYNVSK